MNKKKILILVIFLLGIGYATVTTTLYINGNINISSNETDFDVKFTKSVIDSEDKTSATISSDGKTISFTTRELQKLNDKSKLDFEITNNSSIYDAEVSIVCTSGERGEYYQITKEVENIIPARYKKTGKIEIEKIKANIDDIEEEFTCTLNASAIERTTKGVAPSTPVCSFSNIEDIERGSTSTVNLTCIDEKSEINSQTLTTDNFKLSNNNGEITEISEPTKIENGYVWNIGLRGVTIGTFNISLNESIIKNSENYTNDKVTSEDIEVVGKTFTATFVKNGDGVASIGSNKLSCTTEGEEESCKIMLPNINVGSGYTKIGWNENQNATTGLLENSEVELTSNKTYYVVTSKKVTITFNGNGATLSKPSESCTMYNTQTSCSITSPIITPASGYSVVGFNTSSSGTTSQWNQNTAINVSSNATYFAITKPNYNLNITGTVPTCILNKTTCVPGTEIQYKVNDSTTKTFKVLHDDGATLALQSSDYIRENVPFGSVLGALKDETSSWDNVNTLNEKTGIKSRRMTIAEASSLGCTTSNNSCPDWLKGPYWIDAGDDCAIISASMKIIFVNRTTVISNIRAVVEISKY